MKDLSLPRKQAPTVQIFLRLFNIDVSSGYESAFWAPSGAQYSCDWGFVNKLLLEMLSSQGKTGASG